MPFTAKDTQCMALALQLASKGRHTVHANPMVGCVIVREGEIIAKDYHREFGKGHAEANALAQINGQASGATLYVTLEPCSHYGKTPPCAEAVISSGVTKVIIATLDPNPLVCGNGVQILEKAGIEVKVGLLENEATNLNRGFIKRMQTGLPFVTSKIAMSLDGKTAMASGESKWITSEAARVDVHKLRRDNQAILTGSGTVLKDNPSMTARLPESSVTPLRVVIDSNNQITDKDLNVLSADAQTLVINMDNCDSSDNDKVDLKAALHKLGELGINTVLVEAGSGLNGALQQANLIDELVIYTAPVLLGSDASSMMQLPINEMKNKVKLKITDCRQVGPDMKITASIE
ncbi:MAG: bifunctional diaminohydroxyphosphoribosylaminopyrimidine deaminase/5-amino-6-(5-phosphoribosylamino)uracil reductase RibD [Gammaproteobacteria bacterium]|nr:bifunctional diaminohydroxyphosphoribosylaminopyrimidine deaminase/5-amino-6-(5-phosphoribosylamino)uracil reductase RibD [Gammaproteobacteria bacterium]